MNKLASFLLKIVLILFIANIILFINYKATPLSVQGEVSVGNPAFFWDDTKYWSEITQIAVSDTQLFVLYDKKKVLACYDLEGNYQYSYAFSMMNNGQSEMFCIGDTLYFRDTLKNYYVFSNGKFAQFYDHNIDTPQILKLEENINNIAEISENNAQKYILRGASIWRVSEDGNKMIVQRPAWLAVFQNGSFIFLHLIYILAMVALFKLQKR